jgi:uracil-DNA glycosylase family 4
MVERGAFLDLIDEASRSLRLLGRRLPRAGALTPAARDTALGWGRAASRRAATAESLADIRADIGECVRCKLASGRTHIVFGQGAPAARLMFVGEGPGHEEDLAGEPFVGAAGQLLNKIIEAMRLQRGDVYIANVVKCRPPGNRQPEEDEIAACSPFLSRQIAAVRPLFVCTLGGCAAQTLLRTRAPISRLRGRFHEVDGLRVLPTFHPAYLLRNPEHKRAVWEDMQLLMKEYPYGG